MSIAEKLVSRLDGGFKFSDLDSFAEVSGWIPTGAPGLDYKLRTKGLPTGIIEVRGDSQSGKTTLSLSVMKNCINTYQERAVVVVLSSERRDNKELAKKIGVPINDIVIINTRTVEKVFTEIVRVVEETNKIWQDEELEGKPRFLFVWDSLGQTVSKDEVSALKTRVDNKKKGDEEKSSGLASAARAISAGLRGILFLLDENEMTFFIINRGYESIGGFIPKTTSYGGKALEFYPTMRLELSRRGGIKVGEEEWGQLTQVKVIKSDFSSPKIIGHFEIGYGYGIVLSDDDIELGIKLGVLKKKGHGAFFNEKLQWGSARELYEHYRRKNPMLKVLISKLNKAAHQKVVEERTEDE